MVFFSITISGIKSLASQSQFYTFLSQLFIRDYYIIIREIDRILSDYRSGKRTGTTTLGTPIYTKITKQEATTRLNKILELFDVYVEKSNEIIIKYNHLIFKKTIPLKPINYSKTNLISYILDKGGFEPDGLSQLSGDRAKDYKKFFFFQPFYAFYIALRNPLEIGYRTVTKTIPKLFTFPNYNFQVISTYLNNGEVHYEWLDITKDGKLSLGELEIAGKIIKPGHTLFTSVKKDLLPVQVEPKEIYLNFNQHVLEKSDKEAGLQILKRVDWEDGILDKDNDLVILGDIGTIVNEKLRELPINQESVKNKYSESIVLEPKTKDFSNNFTLGQSYNFFETSDNILREYGISYLTSYSWKMNDPTVKCIFGGYLFNLTDKLKADNVFYNTTTNSIDVRNVGTEKINK